MESTVLYRCPRPTPIASFRLSAAVAADVVSMNSYYNSIGLHVLSFSRVELAYWLLRQREGRGNLSDALNDKLYGGARVYRPDDLANITSGIYKNWVAILFPLIALRGSRPKSAMAGPNIWLTTFQISCKSVHFWRSYKPAAFMGPLGKYNKIKRKNKISYLFRHFQRKLASDH